MCGITGAVWTDPAKSLSREVLGAMMTEIDHRGPDDASDFYLNHGQQTRLGKPSCALGFRRLAIIDLEGSRQPISNEDHSVQLIFNGEIYNFVELRNQLIQAGHRFRTQGDAEVVVHLYEEYGTDGFEKLNGMFGLAIWDQVRNRLVLARDRLGQKPLVYRHESGRTLFASELKSILQVPGIDREIDPDAIDLYLTYQYVPHPWSIFKGFNKLSPGHYAVIENGNLTTGRYWNPDLSENSSITDSEAAEQFRELFDSSISLRMQSDVPLGAFLSGGIDSSLVVASMCRQVKQPPVKTFSIGFPVKEFDESAYAQQVADHLGTEHHRFTVTPDARAILDQLVYLYDEPFGDSSAIPTWYVSKLTREHVTVALSGDGGDELFAGYNRYQAVRFAERLDWLGPIKSLMAAQFWQWIPSSSKQKSRVRQFKRFSEALGLPVLKRYLNWIGIYNDQRRRELYRDDFSAGINIEASDFLLDSYRQFEHRDSVSAISLTDLQTYLPCDLNQKVDIASMGHGLECRQPFLDHRLVQFAINLPVRMKIRKGRSKWLLHEAFGSELPANIWNRKKMGFGVPLSEWFRTDLKDLLHDAILTPDARIMNYFSLPTIQKLADEHARNDFDHSYRLWALLMLELWIRRWA